MNPAVEEVPAEDRIRLGGCRTGNDPACDELRAVGMVDSVYDDVRRTHRHDKLDLFRRMVQTGSMLAALEDGQEDGIGKAMSAVEVAGTIQLTDIPYGVSPAGAAHQLVNHCMRGEARPEWLQI